MGDKMKILILILFFNIFLNAESIKIGNYNFYLEQINNYKLAYKYGSMINQEKDIMAIMYVENAGKQNPIGDKSNKPFERSYGIMQVKLGTYYWMSNSGYLYKEDMLEEEVLSELMFNPKFNVYVATSYYKYLLDKCGSRESAIIGYNTGYCNPTKNSKAYYKGKDYLQKVNSFVNFINKHNFDRFVRNH